MSASVSPSYSNNVTTSTSTSRINTTSFLDAKTKATTCTTSTSSSNSSKSKSRSTGSTCCTVEVEMEKCSATPVTNTIQVENTCPIGGTRVGSTNTRNTSTIDKSLINSDVTSSKAISMTSMPLATVQVPTNVRNTSDETDTTAESSTITCTSTMTTTNVNVTSTTPSGSTDARSKGADARYTEQVQVTSKPLHLTNNSNEIPKLGNKIDPLITSPSSYLPTSAQTQSASVSVSLSLPVLPSSQQTQHASYHSHNGSNGSQFESSLSIPFSVRNDTSIRVQDPMYQSTLEKILRPFTALQCREMEWNQMKDCYDRILFSNNNTNTYNNDSDNENEIDDGLDTFNVEESQIQQQQQDDSSQIQLSPKHVIMLRGESGIGKTTLAMYMKQYHTVIQNQKACLEVHFNPVQSTTVWYQPFFMGVYNYIQQLDYITKQKVNNKMQQDLTIDEWNALPQIVPEFRLLFPETTNKRTGMYRKSTSTVTTSLPSSSQDTGTDLKPTKLNILFKKILMAIFCPYLNNDPNISINNFMFLFILYDIQYAQEVDLELFFMFVKYPKPFKLLYVVTYKSDVTPNNNNNTSANSVYNSLQDIHTLTEEIHLQSLNDNQIRYILTTQFFIPTNNTSVDRAQQTIDSLANEIKIKTSGNFFLISQYFHYLIAMGIIYPNDEQLDNNVHGKKVVIDSNTSDVVNNDTSNACIDSTEQNLVLSTFFDFSIQCQDDLKMAACLGCKGDDTLAKYVLPFNKIQESLEEASSRQFIIVNTSNVESWDFTHQKIRDDVYYHSMDETERSKRHHRIGRKLWRELDLDQLTKCIFQVVDHLLLGKGEIIDIKERIGVAKLCLSAGERAAQSSAFQTARSYFFHGISMLDTDQTNHHWRDEYDLTLSLYSGAAECSFTGGFFDDVYTIHDIVIAHAKNFTDSMRVRIIMLNTMGSLGQMTDARNIGIDMLRKLGERFPRDPCIRHVFWELVQLKTKMIRKKIIPRRDGSNNNDGFNKMLQLPVMKDPAKLAAMQVFNLSLLYAMCTSSSWASLFGIRMMNLTIDYGISGLSCMGIAIFADALCSVGMVDDGYKFGQVALAVFDRFQNRSFFTRFYSIYYLGVHSWKHPLSEFIDQMKYAHLVGLETGDNEFAMLSGFDYYFIQMDVMPLSLQDRGYHILSERARKIKQESSLTVVALLRQLIKNLTKDNYSDVSTEIFTRNRAETECYELKEKIPLLYKISCFPQFVRRFLFGDYSGAKTVINEFYTVARRTDSYPSISSIITLLEGLVFISIARTERRRISSRGRRCSKALQNYANHEPYGHYGRHLLLEAELADLFGRPEGYTLAKYTAAISVEKESGSLMVLAIANEVTAKFLIRKRWTNGELAPLDALRYIREAILTYKKWGAIAKVRHLEQEMYGYGYKSL